MHFVDEVAEPARNNSTLTILRDPTAAALLVGVDSNKRSLFVDGPALPEMTLAGRITPAQSLPGQIKI